MGNLKFSLVSTVFNEAKRLSNTIADIEAQLLPPTEIVITDAGSTDGTWEQLMAWQNSSDIPIILLQEQGCNVARGRNLAIAKAGFSIIASTDFGCRFHEAWLQSIIAPFANAKIDVVGGAFAIDDSNVTEMSAKADYVLQNGYKVNMDKYFSVSSRSIAYKKEVWAQIGGYEEWLTLAADDTIFWRLIKQAGYQYQFTDKPYVQWLRHESYAAFAKEAYRYGLGDGESLINTRNTVSHIVELLSRYLLFFGVFVGIWSANLLVWLMLLPLFYFGLRSYRAAYRNWKTVDRKYSATVLLSAFYMLEYSRLKYLQGYIKGSLLANATQRAARKLLSVRLANRKSGV